MYMYMGDDADLARTVPSMYCAVCKRTSMVMR